MSTFRKEKRWPFGTTPGVFGVCYDGIFAFMVLCAQLPLIWYATWLLSQKDMVWPHPLGWGCVCGQNISYHVAASIVSFNLICNMTIFWKKIRPRPPNPKSTSGARTQAFRLKSHLIHFISIAALLLCKISAKILTIALVIAKLKYATFDPLCVVKGGGV